MPSQLSATQKCVQKEAGGLIFAAAAVSSCHNCSPPQRILPNDCSRMLTAPFSISFFMASATFCATSSCTARRSLSYCSGVLSVSEPGWCVQSIGFASREDSLSHRPFAPRRTIPPASPVNVMTQPSLTRRPDVSMPFHSRTTPPAPNKNWTGPASSAPEKVAAAGAPWFPNSGGIVSTRRIAKTKRDSNVAIFSGGIGYITGVAA